MSKEQINLIYFGRITASKNIDIIIKTLSIIMKRGVNARLDLIGGYAEEYKKVLNDCIQKENLSEDNVIFHGVQSLNCISEKLKNAHYFVFPSTEIKEGHSNSLTEAMAFGVVPIVSNAGFNKFICGDDRLVVSTFSPNAFAEKVINIEESGEWDFFSHFVYKRIINQFTETQATEVLKEVLRILGENKERI